MNNQIYDIIINIKEEISSLSDNIYFKPELGNEEFISSNSHMEILEKHGFIIEREYLGILTSFKATFDTHKGNETVAYLAEYDALPEIGHGCGHNLLGAVSTGAGIVLSKIINKGRVIVFGTPAEETNGAKVDFAREGAFKDIDVALIAHPSDHNAASMKSLALEALEFTFEGKSSHASASPEKGVNALFGAINMFNNINALRAHLPQNSSIHGIIKEGGIAANIVPDKAVNQFYIRGESKKQVEELSQNLINCGKAGALASGTKVSYRNYEKSYDEFISNYTLMHRYMYHMKDMGIPSMAEIDNTTSSVDTGNVSKVLPTLHSWFSITKEDIALHTREFAEETRSDYAKEQMVKAIYGIVMTGYDILNDYDFRKDVNEEFKNTIDRG